MRFNFKTLVFIIFLISLLPLTLAIETALTFDGNGNLESGDGYFRVYNGLNQLSKIYTGSNASGTLLYEYTFDPTEDRVAIKHDYVKNRTIYYFDKEYMRLVNSSGTFNFEFAYFEGQLIAQINPDGSKYFFILDQKGSIVGVTDENGALVENKSYDPYGNSVDGMTITPYGYEGKEHDSVVGDIDFKARRYNPNLAMFEQPDTLIQNVYDPQSLNRYSFERNNPIKNIDPTGHEIALPFGDAFGDLFKFPVENPYINPYNPPVDVPVGINVEQSDKASDVGWSDWTKKDVFGDGREKWFRENDNEFETWEENDPHQGMPYRHINDRIYDKNKLKQVEEWKKSGRVGPKPNSDPINGPDDHHEADPNNHDPTSYRSGKSKTSPIFSFFSYIITTAKKEIIIRTNTGDGYKDMKIY